MKGFMYFLTQKVACFGLYCYFREMRLHGLDDVPKDRAVMFLANHQNALLDPLVIAAFTPFRSYFLTRADVFINPVVSRIFSFLRMLPIYRMRDGRDTLGRNELIFEKCTHILEGGGSILLFPEANHNIMRRVRPLSKGFTRILFATLEKDPELDVLLVPVGINYQDAAGFPDRVAFYFGLPFSARSLYDRNEVLGSVSKIKHMVSEALKQRTTHIGEELDYTEMQNYLDSLGVDYLDPGQTNAALGKYPEGIRVKRREPCRIGNTILKWIFLVINAPVLLLWKGFIKPRILEVEFISTYRFAYLFLAQPLFYLLLWVVCRAAGDAFWASVIVAGHFLLNLIYVKAGRRPLSL